MKIGFTELLVVFIVALFVIGPDKLPAYLRQLGKALAEFRKISDEATKDIRENIVEPLEEAQKPLREALEPVEELDRSVRGNIREVQKSLSDIGKPKKAAASAKKADEPNSRMSAGGAQEEEGDRDGGAVLDRSVSGEGGVSAEGGGDVTPAVNSREEGEGTDAPKGKEETL